jgi:hypothetical protein
MIMGSGFDDWIYRHFSTIRVIYNTSHIELELLPNDVCDESLTAVRLSDWSLLYLNLSHWPGFMNALPF